MISKCVQRPCRGGQVWPSVLALAVMCFGLISVTASTNAAVFGRDDRTPVPENLAQLSEMIGRLHNPQIGTNCTAFCVAPNVVATAAHCLYRKPAGRTLRMRDFRFDLLRDGKRVQSTIEGASISAASQHIVTGTTRLRVRPPIDAGSDWALFRTQENICENRVLPVEVKSIQKIERSSDRKEMFQVAYHSDYQDWELAYSRPCKVREQFPDLRLDTIRRDFKNTENLILHQCDTMGASSGSPILRMSAEGPVVVGINVGTYIQSKVLIRNGQVARKFEARPVANTGVNAAVFKAYIDILHNADILTEKKDLQQLQTVLHQADKYRGAIDGVFGKRTRQAIRAYQSASGVRATGLPTRNLLPALPATELPVPVRKPRQFSRNVAIATDGITQLLQQID